MSGPPIAWITHEDCHRHDAGAGHPESSARLEAVERAITASALAPRLQRHAAPLATREQLRSVHTTRHLDAVFGPLASAPRMFDPDTVQGRHTLAAAQRAAGAGVLGTDLLLRGEVQTAFCAVRPPGHHAERDRAMGFCFFGNAALAAHRALELGLERVAILDFDVHYGNGTADIIAGDERIWMYSTYQSPLFPHWQGRPDVRNLVDVPLQPHTGFDWLRAAVTSRWMPALARQKPQLIIVSAGFDAHEADPLAHLQWQDRDYRWLGQTIAEFARRWADGRVLATLEGGYDLDALGRSVVAFLEPLA